MVINMLELTPKENQMALENIHGQMVVITKASFQTAWGKAKENGFTSMGLSMKATSKTILNKDMVNRLINLGSTSKEFF